MHVIVVHGCFVLGYGGSTVAKCCINYPPSTETCEYPCRWVSLQRPRADSALSNGGLSWSYGRTVPKAGICVETAHEKTSQAPGILKHLLQYIFDEYSRSRGSSGVSEGNGIDVRMVL